jgi:hypothetical protein
MSASQSTTRLAALALAALGVGYLTVQAVALGDDTPPPSSAPGDNAPQGRHHNNPAWAACKKQADDQKLEQGDARREFMKNCMQSAKDAAPPASS